MPVGVLSKILLATYVCHDVRKGSEGIYSLQLIKGCADYTCFLSSPFSIVILFIVHRDDTLTQSH